MKNILTVVAFFALACTGFSQLRLGANYDTKNSTLTSYTGAINLAENLYAGVRFDTPSRNMKAMFVIDFPFTSSVDLALSGGVDLRHRDDLYYGLGLMFNLGGIRVGPTTFTKQGEAPKWELSATVDF